MKCESCDDKGYLEVTREDSCEYIEACDNCNYIDMDGLKDESAQLAAIKDGYMLDEKGMILDCEHLELECGHCIDCGAVVGFIHD